MNTTKQNNRPSTTLRARIKPGYKKTPIGIIPEDWEVKKLEEIGDFKNGINKSKEDFGFGVPFINLNDIFNLNYDSLELVNANQKEINLYNLKKGDVLFVRSSVKPEGVGLTSVIEENMEDTVYSGFIIRFRPKKHLELNYKKYCFNEEHFRHRLITKSTISANTNINQQALNSLYLKIPPLPEQKHIANCLSTWDSGIEKLTQLIQAKKQQKKGLMQQLFNGQLTVNNGQLQRVENQEDWLKGWEEVRLGEITKRVKRKNDELNDTVVTISAQRGFVLQEEYFTKRVASKTLSNYYLLERGEFAYNKSYSNGYPMGAFKRLDDFDHAVVTTLYICFKVKNNVNSDFLLNFFEAGLMNRNLTKIAQEGGRAHGLLNIGLADFFDLKLKIPSLIEQTAIAKILQSTDKEIELLEQKLSAMQEQKKGLMQVLLTGEKRLI